MPSEEGLKKNASLLWKWIFWHKNKQGKRIGMAQSFPRYICMYTQTQKHVYIYTNIRMNRRGLHPLVFEHRIVTFSYCVCAGCGSGGQAGSERVADRAHNEEAVEDEAVAGASSTPSVLLTLCLRNP